MLFCLASWLAPYGILSILSGTLALGPSPMEVVLSLCRPGGLVLVLLCAGTLLSVILGWDLAEVHIPAWVWGG
jgi:uncharacterized membrane protein